MHLNEEARQESSLTLLISLILYARSPLNAENTLIVKEFIVSVKR